MTVKIVQGIARAVLITAGIVLITALILTVIGWRLMMWPYRSTHSGNSGERRKLEAGLALITAAAALWAALRTSRAQQPGERVDVVTR